jgi:hypothetical protein
MIAILFGLTAGRRIADIFMGTWSTVVTYSSPPGYQIGPNFTVVATGKVTNYLALSLGDEQILINLSFTDLSGNITYLGEVYDYNLTQVAPPFVSTDIDFREFGFAHCIFGSYITLRCSLLKNDQRVTVTFQKDEDPDGPSKSSFLINALKYGALIAIVGVIYYVYTTVTAPKEEKQEAAEGTATAQEKPSEKDDGQAEEGAEFGKVKTD